MSTMIEGSPGTSGQPLKDAQEANGMAQRWLVRACLLAALAPLTILPIYAEQMVIGWGAFFLALAISLLFADPLAKKLFTAFDTRFENATGLNYTSMLHGYPVPRERLLSVHTFLTQHGEEPAARRGQWASIAYAIVTAVFTLGLIGTTAMDYLNRQTGNIVINPPEDYRDHIVKLVADDSALAALNEAKPGAGKMELPIDPGKGADVFTGIATQTIPAVENTRRSLAQASEAIEIVRKNPALAPTAIEPLKEAIADLKALARDEKLAPEDRAKAGALAEKSEDTLRALDTLAKDPSSKEAREEFEESSRSFLEQALDFLQKLLEILTKLMEIFGQVFGDGAGTSGRTRDSAHGAKPSSGKPSSGGKPSPGAKPGAKPSPGAKPGAEGHPGAKPSSSTKPAPKIDPSVAERMRDSLGRDLARGSAYIIADPGARRSISDLPTPNGVKGEIPGAIAVKEGPGRTGKLDRAKAKNSLQTQEKGASQFDSSVK